MSASSALRARAHPRAGGENRRPPRPPRRSAWLIPARAGKTLVIVGRCVCPQAHPRAGGENTPVRCDGDPDAGSSPRGRGKPGQTTSRPCLTRLIPARAGKTGLPTRSPPTAAAHPRAGGENTSQLAANNVEGGSSPRGRGKRPLRRDNHRPAWLIPARAGKTLWPTCERSKTPAHPRAGGENEIKGPLVAS